MAFIALWLPRLLSDYQNQQYVNVIQAETLPNVLPIYKELSPEEKLGWVSSLYQRTSLVTIDDKKEEAILKSDWASVDNHLILYSNEFVPQNNEMNLTEIVRAAKKEIDILKKEEICPPLTIDFLKRSSFIKVVDKTNGNKQMALWALEFQGKDSELVCILLDAVTAKIYNIAIEKGKQNWAQFQIKSVGEKYMHYLGIEGKYQYVYKEHDQYTNRFYYILAAIDVPIHIFVNYNDAMNYDLMISLG